MTIKVNIKKYLCISKVSYALHTTLARQPKLSSLEQSIARDPCFTLGVSADTWVSLYNLDRVTNKSKLQLTIQMF
jgi:hypothetical protein